MHVLGADIYFLEVKLVLHIMLIILYIQHVMNELLVVVYVEQVLHYICEYILPSYKYITIAV